VCLVCNVQLTEIIIVFFRNEWAALTLEPVDALCVWSTIRQAASNELFSQGSAATLFRLGW